jgi:prephenate dehydratase
MTSPVTVAFQGEPGAYSEAACVAHFGPDVHTQPNYAFEDVFASVVSGACQYGLIPIENSLAGSIHRNYDLLLEHDLHITAEHFLRVQHCLIGLPGADLSTIRKVTSHPQALAQCDHYLRSLPNVSTEAAHDTAGSVRLVKERGDPAVAAIASRRAAEVYGLPVIAEGIEDNPANYTRFLVISRQPDKPGPDSKTSIVFSLKNIPGSLFRALGVFALRDIDLTKIESRPLAGKSWEYFFYIDFSGSPEQPNCSRALDHLAEMATFMRLLGSYPRHRW